MAEVHAATGAAEKQADQLRSGGATVLFMAVEGTLAGMIAIADPIKSSTRAALDDLRKDRIRIVMLTGDNKATAQAVASKLESRMSRPMCCPKTRTVSIKRLKAEGRTVRHGGGWRQ